MHAVLYNWRGSLNPNVVCSTILKRRSCFEKIFVFETRLLWYFTLLASLPKSLTYLLGVCIWNWDQHLLVDNWAFRSYRTEQNFIVSPFIICQQYSANSSSILSHQIIFYARNWKITHLQIRTCGQIWFYCYNSKNHRWIPLACFGTPTASMVLLASRAMSVSINLKILIVMWWMKNTKDYRKVWIGCIASIAWWKCFSNDGKLARKSDLDQSSVEWSFIANENFKVLEMGASWTSWETGGKLKFYLRKSGGEV